MNLVLGHIAQIKLRWLVCERLLSFVNNNKPAEMLVVPRVPLARVRLALLLDPLLPTRLFLLIVIIVVVIVVVTATVAVSGCSFDVVSSTVRHEPHKRYHAERQPKRSTEIAMLARCPPRCTTSAICCQLRARSVLTAQAPVSRGVRGFYGKTTLRRANQNNGARAARVARHL